MPSLQQIWLCGDYASGHKQGFDCTGKEKNETHQVLGIPQLKAWSSPRVAYEGSTIHTTIYPTFVHCAAAQIQVQVTCLSGWCIVTVEMYNNNGMCQLTNRNDQFYVWGLVIAFLTHVIFTWRNKNKQQYKHRGGCIYWSAFSSPRAVCQTNTHTRTHTHTHAHTNQR